MTKLSFAFCALMTAPAWAAPVQASDPQLCAAEATNAIIQYLVQEEPKAQLSVVINPAGEITGITDSQKIYGTLNFESAIEESPNVRVIVFSDVDYVVFATVDTSAQANGSTCKVLNVDSGQNDHD